MAPCRASARRRALALTGAGASARRACLRCDERVTRVSLRLRSPEGPACLQAPDTKAAAGGYLTGGCACAHARGCLQTHARVCPVLPAGCCLHTRAHTRRQTRAGSVLHTSYAHCRSAICADSGAAMCIRVSMATAGCSWGCRDAGSRDGGGRTGGGRKGRGPCKGGPLDGAARPAVLLRAGRRLAGRPQPPLGPLQELKGLLVKGPPAAPRPRLDGLGRDAARFGGGALRAWRRCV